MEIMQLVDQFEALLTSSLRIPGTDRVLVNESECQRLIEQMRITVPDVVKQAQRTMHERDRLLAQAKEESERVVARARERANGLIEEHDIVRQAQERAAQVLHAAENTAQHMRGEADAYAVSVLQDLSAQLERATAQVQNGIAALRPSHNEPASRS
jgi:vacuolar-type H+-ATPase subunit H